MWKICPADPQQVCLSHETTMSSCTESGIVFCQGTEGSSDVEQRIPLNSAQAGVAAEEGGEADLRCHC